jgi:hypothetical protein
MSSVLERSSVTIALLMGWFVVLSACDADGARKVTAADCVKLRDHRAGLLVDRSASQLDQDEKARHRANISAAAGDEFVKRCVEETTVTSLECQLEARSVGELERCERGAKD